MSSDSLGRLSTTRRELRIAYVASRFPSLSETFVYREWLGLRARGHRMTAISVRRPVAAIDPGLRAIAAEAVVVYSAATLWRLPLALALHPRLAIKAAGEALTADLNGPIARAKYLAQAWMGIAVAGRLRDRSIGHVHAHLAHVPATIGLHAARALAARFSFTGHAADLFVDRAALAFKLREATFVAAISEWHRRFYRDIVGGVEAPVIRCGVALPSPREPADGRDIVVVARLVAKKGIDLLLHAVAELDDRSVRVRIAGDGPEAESLAALAGRLGIADRVEFLGARPHRECLDLIAGAAVFVLPCRLAANGDRDGIPVVLMEAMAAQRAVIAGALPTIAELIAHDVNGLLVEPNESEALAAALSRLLSDPDLRTRLGRAARRRIAEEFADAMNLDRLEQALAQACGPGGPPKIALSLNGGTAAN